MKNRCGHLGRNFKNSKNKTNPKKLFYYDLTIRNPSTVHISLHVAVMISSDQTLWSIGCHVLGMTKKKLRVASRLSQPVQINSDRAMVFVVTVMRVFNNETLVVFLDKSWKILHGTATLKELRLTGIHTCAFYFMRNAKEIVKRTMKVGSRSVGMSMLSLLMNRENIRDLESAIKLIIIVTCSNYLISRVRLCIGTLNKVLKDFKADIFEETTKPSKTSAVS